MPLATMPPPQPDRSTPAGDAPGPDGRRPRRKLALFRWRSGGGRKALAFAAWVALAVAASLAAGSLAGALVGWVVLGIFLLSASWRGWRRRRGGPAGEVAAAPERRRDAPRGAFRGLYPFEPGERLPGNDRARVARHFADWLMAGNPTYRFLCAESGCGKTSLVRTELWARLEGSGWSVRYFDGRSAGGGDPWEGVLDEVGAVAPSEQTVFILDQFERYFAAEPSVVARNAFGARLQAALDRCPGLRVLCIVPASHMLHLADLSPGLGDPTSNRSLLPLRQLSTGEARDIILECGRMDGLEVPAPLASALAQDLSEDGRVRPTELQIVCTYLGRSFSEDRYRMAGGAGGILAQHVRRALAKAEPSEMGARLLRAMCDFGEVTRAGPQTVDELATQAAGKASAETREAVRRLLRLFMEARIVRRAEGDDAERFELVHDYLVQPVGAATSTAATRRETANQQLDYLLRSGDRAIPFRRAWRIYRHADPALRSTARARRLLWPSLVLPPVRWTLAGVLLLGTVAVAASALGNPTWNEEAADSQPAGKGVVIGARSYAGPRRVVSADWNSANTVIRDSAGNRVAAVPGGWRKISPNGRWVFVQRQAPAAAGGDPAAFAVFDVAERQELPIPFTAPDRIGFASDSVLLYLDTPAGAAGSGRRDFVAYSLTRRRELGRIRDVPGAFLDGLDASSDDPAAPSPAFLSASETRLVAPFAEGGRSYPVLYDLSTGQRLAELRDPSEVGDVRFAVDERRGQVLTVAQVPGGGLAIRRWSLQTGSALPGAARLGDAAAREIGPPREVLLGRDGADLLVSGKYKGILVDARDLSFEGLVNLNLRSFARGERIAAFAEGETTTLRDLSHGQGPLLIRTATGTRDLIAPAASARRVIVLHHAGPAELWAPRAPKPVAVLRVPGVTTDAFWSEDSAAVLVNQKRSLVSAFDAETGEPLGAFITKPAPVTTATYSRACRRLTVWYADGKVIRWTEGRRVLGRMWATGSCTK
jgi:hypothetical protein